MLLELYIFFEIIVIVLFITSFFTKQEILWSLTLIFSGILMFTSYNIEYNQYVLNVTLGAYEAVTISYSYSYLMGLNFIFFSLAMVLMLFDIFDKYGSKFAGKNPFKGARP